jgi:phenylalanyl-tRNA synthetase beta chain
MKICDSWLREWVNHGLGPDALAERLTMLGLEVESVAALGSASGPLVVGRVLARRPHPGADRLSLCRVDVGESAPVDIVCGARNVREGGLYVTALPGAELPGGLIIKPTRIRGENSAGMLCSAQELGLDETSEGLLELDADATPGADAGRLLCLGDVVLDINLTPNRADCFSVKGIAREVATLSPDGAFREPVGVAISPRGSHELAVEIVEPRDCARFSGRVIRGIRGDARTPLWMAERLRRCGVRPISPIVDVTNYVMLERGQPMHAYDLERVQGGIRVRHALPGESLTLLDGQTVRLDPAFLVIADASGPIALAGIMGGQATAVTADTRDVFLESAFFSPVSVAGRCRRLGLQTDSAVRFERGVDPAGQAQAVELATRMILEIGGGEPGPLLDVSRKEHLPKRLPVRLRKPRATRILGVDLPDVEVERILARLGMDARPDAQSWVVTAPSCRFDIEREEDLIEEIARVHGYANIPATAASGTLHLGEAREEVHAPADAARALLVARGYSEAITYSFIDSGLGREFGMPQDARLTLSNPISSDLAVMRDSLWPGLVRAARDNLHRQQQRVRLFEVGSRYFPLPAGGSVEEASLAAVAIGGRLPEQWGVENAPVDFFDIKADVAALLSLAGKGAEIAFQAATHPALHPGRSAAIVADGRRIGLLGEMHPALAGRLGMPNVALFELQVAAIAARTRPGYRPISRYPAVRRDLSPVVALDLETTTLLAVVHGAAPASLQEAFVFDIYAGPQISATEKSVSIGLILQDTSRTLTDEEVEEAVRRVRASLVSELAARFRE